MGQLTNRKWWEAAATRAVRTMAQAALVLIPAGVAIQDIGWAQVFGMVAAEGVVSMLMSLKGLPEVDGTDPKAEPSEPKADPDDTAELPRHLGR